MRLACLLSPRSVLLSFIFLLELQGFPSDIFEARQLFSHKVKQLAIKQRYRTHGHACAQLQLRHRFHGNSTNTAF